VIPYLIEFHSIVPLMMKYFITVLYILMIRYELIQEILRVITVFEHHVWTFEMLFGVNSASCFRNCNNPVICVLTLCLLSNGKCCVTVAVALVFCQNVSNIVRGPAPSTTGQALHHITPFLTIDAANARFLKPGVTHKSLITHGWRKKQRFRNL